MTSAFLAAGLLGLLSGSGLTLGALAADVFSSRLSHRIIAAVMGLGAGTLIAIVSADTLEEAYAGGDATLASGSLLVGAATFSLANWLLTMSGARHRKRCGGCVRQADEKTQPGSGLAIAVGSVLDGVPEALIIGISLVDQGRIGASLIAGFFVANVPQGLSSASGMLEAGRSRAFVYSVWAGIPLLIGITAAAGASVLRSAPPWAHTAIIAFSAGAVLAMLAEAMIPEAFEKAPPFIGLITVVGFLAAFSLL